MVRFVSESFTVSLTLSFFPSSATSLVFQMGNNSEKIRKKNSRRKGRIHNRYFYKLRRSLYHGRRSNMSDYKKKNDGVLSFDSENVKNTHRSGEPCFKKSRSLDLSAQRGSIKSLSSSFH